MVADGFTITRAIQSRSWPAASANLEYAAAVAEDVPRVADDLRVRRISTLLEPAGRVEGVPIRLTENEGIAYIGCYVLGMGFVLDEAEAQEWIAADARNAEVLFPYLNGEDLNSRPDASASRWVIDFNDRPEAEAAKYVLPFDRVKRQVKPERDRLDGRNPTATDRARNWWKFGRRSPAMRKAIAGLPEVLVIALVSKAVMPVRVPTRQMFAHKLGVFATDSSVDQAVLSSSFHQMWAIKFGSTLESRVNYSPSDVFETFPRPEPTAPLELVGRTLDEVRRDIMLRRDLDSPSSTTWSTTPMCRETRISIGCGISTSNSTAPSSRPTAGPTSIRATASIPTARCSAGPSAPPPASRSSIASSKKTTVEQNRNSQVSPPPLDSRCRRRKEHSSADYGIPLLAPASQLVRRKPRSGNRQETVSGSSVND